MSHDVIVEKPIAAGFAKKGELPKQWWQWRLLYPGIAVAIIGVVPTYIEVIESYSLGVRFGRSFDATEQNRLWQENFECAQRADFSPIVNKKKVEIATVVCESGDVLLRGKRPDWEGVQIRWVSWDEVAPTDMVAKKSFGFLDIVKAADPSQPKPPILAQAPVTSVLCQRWLSPGQPLQRVSSREGCFDEVIDTYNGRVISRRPAPCNPPCEYEAVVHLSQRS